MKKILVVDDEYIILQGIVHLIDWKLYGYEIVFETQSPVDAIEYIEKHPVDIVLSDIVMPNMSGLDLLKKIKEINTSIHVVIISSYEEFSYAQEALRLGASDYILKSTLNPQQVLNTINALVIENKQASSQDLKFNVKQDLKLLFNNQNIDSDNISTYFKFQYFKLIFIKSTQAEDFASDYLRNYRYLLHEFTTTTCVIINFNKFEAPIFDSNYSFFYTEDFTSYLDFYAHKKQYDIQKSLRFYYPNSRHLPIKDSFIWSQNLNFNYKFYDTFIQDNKLFHALDYFCRFIDVASELKTINPDELKSFASSIIYQFISSLERKKLQSEHIDSFKLQMISSIQNAETSQILIGNIGVLMNNLSIIIQNYLESSHNSLRKNFLSYLEENYQKKINLQDMADYFNFSYHYMSELFNTNFEASFNDTLNEIRIKKAKELVKDLSLNLQSIAQDVGYSNYSHFSKTFKHYTNMSPSEYRRSQV